jgi:hypothetical protein
MKSGIERFIAFSEGNSGLSFCEKTLLVFSSFRLMYLIFDTFDSVVIFNVAATVVQWSEFLDTERRCTILPVTSELYLYVM